MARKPIRNDPNEVLKSAKRVLAREMKAANENNCDLAKRMGTVEGTVRHLLDLSHNTHSGTVEAVLRDHYGVKLQLATEPLGR